MTWTHLQSSRGRCPILHVANTCATYPGGGTEKSRRGDLRHVGLGEEALLSFRVLSLDPSTFDSLNSVPVSVNAKRGQERLDVAISDGVGEQMTNFSDDVEYLSLLYCQLATTRLSVEVVDCSHLCHRQGGNYPLLISERLLKADRLID